MSEERELRVTPKGLYLVRESRRLCAERGISEDSPEGLAVFSEVMAKIMHESASFPGFE